MRTKREAKIDKQVKQKRPSPAGGKVLRRLFAYLAERDPALNNDIVATLVVPKATVPKFVFPKQTSPIKAARTLSARPTKRRGAAAAKSFGAAISKAATSLTRAPRARKRTRAMAAAPGAAAAASWQSLGPDHVPALGRRSPLRKCRRQRAVERPDRSLHGRCDRPCPLLECRRSTAAAR